MLILNAIMTLFFFTTGISYSRRFRKFEKYIFVALVIHDISLICGLTLAFFHASKRIQKIEIASCTTSMIMVTWFRWVLCIQRNYLHKTIDVLTEDATMKYKTHRRVQERFFIIIFFIVLSSVMIFLSPILRFVTETTVNYNDSSIYIVPFLFKFRDVRSLIEYVSLVSLQGSMIAFNANGCWSYVIFTSYMLCNLEAHIENINEKMVELLEAKDEKLKSQSQAAKMDGKRGSNFQIISHKFMKEGFEKLIRYQQFFYEHLKNFMNYLYWTYVGFLIWILLTLILTMFAMSQIPKDVFFLMKKISISVNFVLVFYLQCYIGEAVSRLADSLLTSFYNTPWYVLPPDIRKDMIIVMIQLQKQCNFNIFGMYTINLGLFTKVVKIVYTITNFLIASQKE